MKWVTFFKLTRYGIIIVLFLVSLPSEHQVLLADMPWYLWTERGWLVWAVHVVWLDWFLSSP